MHIVAVVILALPDAGKLANKPERWNNPTVKAEFEAWAERLDSMGWDTDAATLRSDVFDAAQSWASTLEFLQAPVKPYADYVGVRQKWRMFVAPHRHPVKLHIELERDGKWVPIQVARSDEYDWRGGQFDHARMRSLLFRYGWKPYRRYYRALARWIATRVAEDFPEARRARIQLYGFRTPTPQEVRDDAIPEGTFREALRFDLESLR